MKKKTIEAWHFLRKDGRLNYPPYTKIRPGVTLKVKVPIALCGPGLHASLKALDALSYAPGAIVCRVRMSGDIIHGPDKLVASERTVIWMADATTLLHEIAAWVGRRVLKRERRAGREPDKRSWGALKAKQLWLQGKISDKELEAAARAAWAARAAMRASWAGIQTVWNAKRAAAWTAAWEAARAAAWVAGCEARTTALAAQAAAAEATWMEQASACPAGGKTCAAREKRIQGKELERRLNLLKRIVVKAAA